MVVALFLTLFLVTVAVYIAPMVVLSLVGTVVVIALMLGVSYVRNN